MRYQHIMDTEKAVLRIKTIAMQVHIRKEEKAHKKEPNSRV